MAQAPKVGQAAPMCDRDYEPPAPPARDGFLPGLLLAAALASVPVVGCNAVWSVAEPGPQQFDVVPSAVSAFLVWLPVPVVAFMLWALGVPRRWAMRVVAVLALAAMGGSLWLVRPQAPDGAGRESLGAGIVWLEESVDRAFADADVTVGTKRPWAPPTPCTDRFGRERGAATSGFSVERGTKFSLDELERLAQAFRNEGWEAAVVDDSAIGGPLRRVEAERDGYRFRTDGTFLDDPEGTSDWGGARASTPCLRTEDLGGRAMR